MVGKTLGHYRILEKIGAGGMGEVYRAHDEQLDRDVALKVLPLSSFTDATARARLLREARAAAALNHPHICTIHEVGEADGQAYIAMELVEGQPLSARLAAGALPTEQVLRFGLQLAEALAHAHERGVVHRDLKSANVIITPEDRAKVLDFGLAKRLSGEELAEATTQSQASLTLAGALVGTVPYMAPEQLRGQPADARSDVWALGVVLYEMAAGARPFQAQTGFELSAAILREPPPPLPAKVPVELRALIERCLEKEPAQRYQRAGELRSALEAVQAGVVAPWLAWRYRLARRPWLALLATVVLLLAILAALNVGGLRTRILGSGQGKIESVAVLPVRNLSEDPKESNYLADGMSEALITKLTQLPNLRVIPWMTAEHYKQSSKTPQQIASEMGVDALVAGSVRRADTRLSVTVSLIDGRTGSQVWADQFEEQVSDLFLVQQRVALGVARQLRETLTTRQEEALVRAPSRSAEAYEYYLRGNAAKRRTKESNELAGELFRKALEIDPNLADGYVGLGDVQWARYYWGWDGDLKNLEQAEAYYERALALNPALPSAYSGLVSVNWLRGSSQGCLQQGQKVASLGLEDVQSIVTRAEAYYFAGLEEKALLHSQRAMELDPANQRAAWVSVSSYVYLGRYKEATEAGEAALRKLGARGHLIVGEAYHQLGKLQQAETHYQKATDLAPDDFVAYINLGVLYKQTGRRAKADQVWRQGLAIVKQMLDAYPQNPRLRTWLAFFYGHLGNKNGLVAEEALVLKAGPDNGALLANLGRARAALGETDQAVEFFRRSLRLGFVGFYSRNTLKAEGIDHLRDSPAYQAFLREYQAKVNELSAVY